MRKLTILRRSTFVACLGRMSVWFEDPVNPTATIDGRPCRLLGKIKNGETVTFEIPNEGGMLYVTSGDRISRGYCSEALPIFPGDQDIYLSGQNEYSYFGGNAFRFDGVNNEITNAHRAATSKKAMKVFFITLAVVLALAFGLVLLGAMIPTEPETFSAGDFSITLDDSFSGYEEGNAYYIENELWAVGVECYKISRLDSYGDEALAAVKSLDDFAEYFYDMEVEDFTNTKALTKEGGLYWYEYEYKEFLLTYRYAQYFFEYDGAYYSVVFGAEESDYDEATVKAWAESIVFD